MVGELYWLRLLGVGFAENIKVAMKAYYTFFEAVLFVIFILDLNLSQRANCKRHGILELAPPNIKESELGLFKYRKMWVSFSVFYSCFETTE